MKTLKGIKKKLGSLVDKDLGETILCWTATMVAIVSAMSGLKGLLDFFGIVYK